MLLPTYRHVESADAPVNRRRAIVHILAGRQKLPDQDGRGWMHHLTWLRIIHNWASAWVRDCTRYAVTEGEFVAFTTQPDLGKERLEHRPNW